eukprot:350208-Chlamydomonas_euryale.AAC.7
MNGCQVQVRAAGLSSFMVRGRGKTRREKCRPCGCRMSVVHRAIAWSMVHGAVAWICCFFARAAVPSAESSWAERHRRCGQSVEVEHEG